ncbi:hypothetical protein GA0074695_5940 [Micromonospora viridifaciens]|uniref:Uncharacterized protein n=1 Tax=Micromonospora viridifaciens TaxID=1881 RepID=A0A1C4ZQC2_MICVI|nr:hypothetical protein [Micromonospora viridifaciens]SCF35178.1 hypothetical protein GA0074695_5940 [Micromonospora viridifaciens]
MSDDLRAQLTHLLQEEDPHRTLDSLESVVIRTYLTNEGYGTPAEDGPLTIEGWVAWVEQQYTVS